MLTIGPISSVFDLATFAIMLRIFHAGAPLFRTGWFVESLATQTLVILVIRTAAPAWTLPPGRGLAVGVATTLGGGHAACLYAARAWLGFVPLPPLFFAFLGLMTVGYLAVVEIAKRRF